MPIITSNKFSRDTYGMRAERLNTIQANLSIIQPELEAPAAIVTWAGFCSFANFLLILRRSLEAPRRSRG